VSCNHFEKISRDPSHRTDVLIKANECSLGVPSGTLVGIFFSKNTKRTGEKKHSVRPGSSSSPASSGVQQLEFCSSHLGCPGRACRVVRIGSSTLQYADLDLRAPCSEAEKRKACQKGLPRRDLRNSYGRRSVSSSVFTLACVTSRTLHATIKPIGLSKFSPRAPQSHFPKTLRGRFIYGIYRHWRGRGRGSSWPEMIYFHTLV
jgi:hypothetical protein